MGREEERLQQHFCIGGSRTHSLNRHKKTYWRPLYTPKYLSWFSQGPDLFSNTQHVIIHWKQDSLNFCATVSYLNLYYLFPPKPTVLCLHALAWFTLKLHSALDLATLIYKLVLHPADTISCWNHFSWHVLLRNPREKNAFLYPVVDNYPSPELQLCLPDSPGPWKSRISGTAVSMRGNAASSCCEFVSSCSWGRLYLTRSIALPAEEFYIMIRTVSWGMSVSQVHSLLSCVPGPGSLLVCFAAKIMISASANVLLGGLVCGVVSGGALQGWGWG